MLINADKGGNCFDIPSSRRYTHKQIHKPVPRLRFSIRKIKHLQGRTCKSTIMCTTLGLIQIPIKVSFEKYFFMKIGNFKNVHSFSFSYLPSFYCNRSLHVITFVFLKEKFSCNQRWTFVGTAIALVPIHPSTHWTSSAAFILIYPWKKMIVKTWRKQNLFIRFIVSNSQNMWRSFSDKYQMQAKQTSHGQWPLLFSAPQWAMLAFEPRGLVACIITASMQMHR